MNRYLYATATCTAMISAVIGLAGNAAAAPAGSSAADTIEDLREQGYLVQVNGSHNGPMAECSVDSVRNASATSGLTVYVDLTCQQVYVD